MQEQVKEFMTAFEQYPCNEGLATLLPLRFKLIDEEVEELKNATNLVETLDAIVDILYVGIGTLVSFETDFDMEYEETSFDATVLKDGISKINTNDLACARTSDEFIEAVDTLTWQVFKLGQMFDLKAAFDEVHRSNMSKLGYDGKPIKNHYGKVLKGPEYSPPMLEAFVPKETND